VKIEPVTEATLPTFEVGLRALAADLGDPWETDRQTLCRALFAERPACYGLLADEGAGVVLFSPVMTTLAGAPGIYVSDLWVSPEARGTGLGRRLLAAAARAGEAIWGATHLRLSVYEDNPAAAAVYDRLGFTAHPEETPRRLSGVPFRTLASLP
jgi:ribosomal protein S18 acetylase RimI-like enzyme